MCWENFLFFWGLVVILFLGGMLPALYVVAAAQEKGKIPKTPWSEDCKTQITNHF